MRTSIITFVFLFTLIGNVVQARAHCISISSPSITRGSHEPNSCDMGFFSICISPPVPPKSSSSLDHHVIPTAFQSLKHYWTIYQERKLRESHMGKGNKIYQVSKTKLSWSSENILPFFNDKTDSNNVPYTSWGSPSYAISFQKYSPRTIIKSFSSIFSSFSDLSTTFSNTTLSADLHSSSSLPVSEAIIWKNGQTVHFGYQPINSTKISPFLFTLSISFIYLYLRNRTVFHSYILPYSQKYIKSTIVLFQLIVCLFRRNLKIEIQQNSKKLIVSLMSSVNELLFYTLSSRKRILFLTYRFFEFVIFLWLINIGTAELFRKPLSFHAEEVAAQALSQLQKIKLERFVERSMTAKKSSRKQALGDKNQMMDSVNTQEKNYSNGQFIKNKFFTIKTIKFHFLKLTNPVFNIEELNKNRLTNDLTKEGQETGNEKIKNSFKFGKEMKLPAFIHFNHGFGASSLSFESCMIPLADIFLNHSRGKTLRGHPILLAHDAPGFGFTVTGMKAEDSSPFKRDYEKSEYGYIFNAFAGNKIIEQELQLHQSNLMGDNLFNTTSNIHQDSYNSTSYNRILPNGIFIGHSMGCITSSIQVLHHIKKQRQSQNHSQLTLDHQNILVLVAPALPISSLTLKETKVKEKSIFEARSSRTKQKKFLSKYIERWITLPIIELSLRVLVSSKRFWEKGLSSAWSNKRTGSVPLMDSTTMIYRFPSLKKNWYRSLAQFLLSFVTSIQIEGWNLDYEDLEEIKNHNQNVIATKSPNSPALKEANIPAPDLIQPKKGLQSLLEEIRHAINRNELRVLIIHGRQDLIVPVTNSRYLHEYISRTPPVSNESGNGANEKDTSTRESLKYANQLIEIDNMGHMPHEENGRFFAQLVTDFFYKN